MTNKSRESMRNMISYHYYTHKVTLKANEARVTIRYDCGNLAKRTYMYISIHY